ncbi:MAG: glycosyltransferase [Candidatus Rokubacteria bacterium]|nr:glycosyltransferase [Candidatus Rokubacteria bacterium]
MRILWVKVGGLWPLTSGGRLRSFHIVSELSRRHRLILLTTHGPADDPGALAARLPRCERIVSLPYAIPKYRSAGFALAVLRSWLSPLPVDILRFRVPSLSGEVRRIQGSEKVDVCVADFLSATPNVPLDGPVPVVLFAHNVEHMIWKRLSENEPRLWRRLLLEIEWRKMRRYEADVCRRAASTITVSDLDRALLLALAPTARMWVTPTGVDTSYFVPDGRREARAAVVFTGSMDWYPNEDAVLWFVDAVLPRIRREVPEASFTVVGRNPTRRLLAAVAEAGVRVTGTVDDVRPYIAEAAVYAVPLRIGGGTRLKIFEALAMGKAVVSTAVGAEGLPLAPGENFLQADEPEEFARAVVSLLRDPARRRQLGMAGRRLVEERYAWPEVTRRFAGQCGEAAAITLPGKSNARDFAGLREPFGKALARRILPRVLVGHLRAFRTLRPRDWPRYWTLRLRRALPARRNGLPGPGAAIRSVLFVCRGNVIRSPMAAALLRRQLAGSRGGAISVASAGLRAVAGEPADPRARRVAGRFGVSLEDHRAQPLTPELVAQADMIVAMDSLIAAELRGRYAAARRKTVLLGEIADPYDGDESGLGRCYERVESVVQQLASGLAPAEEHGTGPDGPGQGGDRS